MFRLALHLVRSRHAIFYVRFVIPRAFSRKHSELRLSLRTRDPRQAKHLAVLGCCRFRGHFLKVFNGSGGGS